MSTNPYNRYSTRGNPRDNSPWRKSRNDSPSRTITPTSSQEGDDNRRSNRGGWSTKSANDRKPWLQSPEDSEEGALRRTRSSDDHVLHTPSNIKQPSLMMDQSDNTGEPSRSFDDLWDESMHCEASMNNVVTPSTPASAAAAVVPTIREEKEAAKNRKKPPPPPPPTSTSAGNELDTSKFAKKKPPPPQSATELDTSRFAKKKPPTSTGAELDTSKFDKKSRDRNDDDEKKPSAQKKKKPPPSGGEFDTSKFAKSPGKKKPAAAAGGNSGGEMDTSKFAKGSRAPPNTPVDAIHHTTGEVPPVAAAAVPTKKNPIKHPRKTKKSGQSKKPSRSKSGESSKKEAAAAAGASGGDVVTLQKQLDRVTFLQKRQFDQLSSLKKMLLASRAKEKECVQSSEEWKNKAEERDEQIISLKKQLDKSQNELHLSKQKLRIAQTSTAAGGGVAVVGGGGVDSGMAAELAAELAEKDFKISQLEQQIQEKDRQQQQDGKAKQEEAAALLKTQEDKIAELEQRLQESEISHKEDMDQLKNSLEITESKLRKKMEQAEKVHEEMEEMREQLTTAHSSIEQLEEERNYSMAKMAELNDMVSSKGGISDTEKELMERAAEISNLTAKLGTAEGKVHDRDDKIYKLEEEIKSINELVKQLSDGFVAEDDELTKNQEVLLDSATSPGQASSLLLMTMMNMLDSMKAKMVTLQKERDDMNAKAADRGIQLAESHIRVDKLRTELRRMRAESAARAQGRGGRGRGGRAPNGGRAPGRDGRGRGGRGPPPPGRGGPGRGSNATSLSNIAMNNQSERDKLAISTRSTPAAPPPTQSRFMNFLRGNLTQEQAVGPEPEKQVVVKT